MKRVIIWLHGLGAQSSDMEQLAQSLQLNRNDIEHVFLQAPSIPVTVNRGLVMPAWYDIKGMQLTDREDVFGIESSETRLIETIEKMYRQGFAYENIILAGFSQGGAMSLYTGLRFKQRLGGIIALSCYLPLANQFDKTMVEPNITTPIFMAIGDLDPIVQPLWALATKKQLEALKIQDIECHHYAMEHSVCWQELEDLRNWINKKAPIF